MKRTLLSAVLTVMLGTALSCSAQGFDADEHFFVPRDSLLQIGEPLAGKISSSGYYKNIRLYGKVKIVNNFEDIKVKLVDHFPDLKVKVVSHFPNRIGEWQFVEYGEDFKVKFVEHFEDIKITYVENFPGLP